MGLSLAENKAGAGGSPPPPATFTTACAEGDCIIAEIALLASPSTGTPSGSDVEVTDNVNSGTYDVVGYYYDGTNGRWVSVHKMVCNAAGVPTVSASLTKSAYGNISSIQRWSGWAGTPTDDPSLTVQGESASSNTISLTPPQTDKPSTLLLFAGSLGTNFSSTPSGWTVLTTAAAFYALAANEGADVPFEGSLNSTTEWTGLIVGIYDAGASFATTWQEWVSQPLTHGMNLTDGQDGGFTGPTVLALCGPEAPYGSIVEVFPIAGGSSGAFVVNDCADIAAATEENQLLSLDSSEITANVPIQINATFRIGLVISSVPAGMAYAVLYDGPGGPGGTEIVYSP